MATRQTLVGWAQSAGFVPTAALTSHWERLLAQLGTLPPGQLDPIVALPPSLQRYRADLTTELEQLGTRLRRDGASALEAQWFMALTVLRWQRAHDARMRLRASMAWSGPLRSVGGGAPTPFTLTVRDDDWQHPTTQWVAIGPEAVQLHVQAERIATDGRWWAFKQQALGVQLDLVARDGGYYCSLCFRRGHQEHQASGTLSPTKAVVEHAQAVLTARSHEERLRARSQ